MSIFFKFTAPVEYFRNLPTLPPGGLDISCAHGLANGHLPFLDMTESRAEKFPSGFEFLRQNLGRWLKVLKVENLTGEPEDLMEISPLDSPSGWNRACLQTCQRALQVGWISGPGSSTYGFVDVHINKSKVRGLSSYTTADGSLHIPSSIWPMGGSVA